ncbi:MAG: hypothetical protein C4K60_14290 [Ideonella sp. MAG2]|nr:MAG: hypothetical protein C4K60_14290 [Ideonella sp. MAG2]
MATFTLAQIERLKREAKQLRRATSLSHTEALNQIASANGFDNWSLLMKHSDAGELLTSKGVLRPLYFTRTPESMYLSLRKVPEPRDWCATTRSESARVQVQDISQALVSSQNAVEYAIDYMKCLLTVPRFKVYSATITNWEMRSWLPYFLQPLGNGSCILVNRNYKPVGQVANDWARYEEFPQLHLRISDDLRGCITVSGSAVGYLFNDGTSPWSSRAAAQAYLERLGVLQQALN